MKPINLKISLIGSFGVGKSTLAVRWNESAFRPTVSPTIGAAYIVRDIYIDGYKAKCHVWDTAGSERFDAIIPIYLRDAQVVFICFDKPDLEKIRKHIDMVLLSNEKAQIFLVMTKCDISDFSEEDMKPVYKLAEQNLYPFYKTSAKNGLGVDLVFVDAFRECYKKLGMPRLPPPNEKRDEISNEQSPSCCILF